jgi:hypothetical protein
MLYGLCIVLMAFWIGVCYRRRPWTLAEGGVTLRGNHARHASSKPLLNATTVRCLSSYNGIRTSMLQVMV